MVDLSNKTTSGWDYWNLWNARTSTTWMELIETHIGHTLNQRMTNMSFTTHESIMNILTKALVLSVLISPFVAAAPQNTTNVKYNEAIDDLKSISVHVFDFRNRHDGNYPQDMYELIQDMAIKEKSSNFDIPSVNALTNVDSKFSDISNLRINWKNAIPYIILHQRPDGSLLGTPVYSSKNSLDVISYTGLYFHNGVSRKEGQAPFANPQGDYVALYSNGTVSVIPYDCVTYVIQDERAVLGFPNQSGIPPLNTITYSEFWSLRKQMSSFIGKPIKPNGKRIENNNGPESLVEFSRIIGSNLQYGLDRKDIWKTFDPSQTEFTLTDVQAGATKLGLDTQVQKLSLAQLQESGSPALLFLKDDGRIVMLTSLDADRAVIIDRSLTRNVERSVLEARYSGEALVLSKTLTQGASIVAEDAVRSIQLKSLDDEVSQQFVLHNVGKTPLRLQLQYPLLGVSDSKLSKDTLAPGETATLDVKVKWRSILNAPTQNVLVSIQTNDPIVPHLQLAILLNSPKTADAK